MAARLIGLSSLVKRQAERLPDNRVLLAGPTRNFQTEAETGDSFQR